MIYDAAIIGAGPSGSYTAYLLARSGRKVAIFDKHKKPGASIVCTGIISEEAYKNFSLPEDATLKDIDSFRLISPSGETFRYQHTNPFAKIVDRDLFDALLIRQAQKEGALFFQESHVEELRSDHRGIYVIYKGIRSHNGIMAKTVVIATGPSSPLIEKIGLKGPDSLLMGVQAKVEGESFEDAEVYIGEKIAPGSFAWAVPIGDGMVRLGLTAGSDPLRHFKNLTRIPSINNRIMCKEIKITCRPVAYGMAKKSYKERILLVGDAAGQVKTTTGGGIYYGLICAELAAKTLISALDKDDFSEQNMSKYERSWKKRLGQEILNGIRVRSIYARLSDSKLDSLVHFASRDGVIPLIRDKARFDWQKTFFGLLLRRSGIKKILSV